MKILIVDDHRLVSEGLAALLEKLPEAPAIRHAADGFEALAQTEAFDPDVILMDITMPGMNGIEATRQIVHEAKSTAAVLVLSDHTDSEFVAEALRCGAKGFLLKSAASDDLVTAIRQVATGQTYLAPAVAGHVVERYVSGDTQGAETPRKYTRLSPRERQTLQMLADGMSVKEIAYKLTLSDKTVHAFRANLMGKLELGSIAALTKYAIKHGLTPLD